MENKKKLAAALAAVSAYIKTEEEALLQRAMGTGGGVHYHGSAKFQAQAGKAFAEALIDSGKK